MLEALAIHMYVQSFVPTAAIESSMRANRQLHILCFCQWQRPTQCLAFASLIYEVMYTGFLALWADEHVCIVASGILYGLVCGMEVLPAGRMRMFPLFGDRALNSINGGSSMEQHLGE